MYLRCFAKDCCNSCALETHQTGTLSTIYVFVNRFFLLFNPYELACFKEYAMFIETVFLNSVFIHFYILARLFCVKACLWSFVIVNPSVSVHQGADDILVLSAGAFVICWTPGLMTLLLDGLMGKDSHAQTYEKYCLVLAECNSLVNPIIYSLRDEDMRWTFKSILCWPCRRRCDQQGEPSPEFETAHLEVPFSKTDH